MTNAQRAYRDDKIIVLADTEYLRPITAARIKGNRNSPVLWPWFWEPW